MQQKLRKVNPWGVKFGVENSMKTYFILLKIYIIEHNPRDVSNINLKIEVFTISVNI